MTPSASTSATVRPRPRHAALSAGMLTLRQDGIEKVLQGLTDMTEVVAATNL